MLRKIPLPRRQRLRQAVGVTTTAVACCLVWFALVAPDRLGGLSPATLARIPVEGLVIAGLAAFLPARPRRVVAVGSGLVLGALILVKALDTGFYDVLDRPFNPVTDWGTFGPAVGVLGDSIGHGWAVTAVVGAIVAAVAVLVVLPLSALRLTRIAADHRATTTRTLAVLSVGWVLCAALGVHIAGGTPVASSSAAGLAYDEIHAVNTALQDRRAFASALSGSDRFRDLPAGDLLSGLRGKDVIIAFVESYGQVAVQGSAFSPQVDEVLGAGTRSLHAAGFDSRSAFLTSPTFGGISWLAHSTLQSGLWVDSQQRYDQLVASNRFTLSDAFGRAGWRTVGDVPSNGPSWPEGTGFYHYDQLYNADNVGYVGPRFSYATMPDQYILSAFRDRELATPQRSPVMAEIDLVSSHTPWAPLPRMVPWNRVGNGAIYDGMPEQGRSPSSVWRHTADVQAAYGQSIRYSLRTLISFVQKVHDNNLVLVVLGDHQPATVVTGSNPTHNVPISIIAHDPAVFDRISSWGWQDGLLPGPQAPVWPMSSFRDRFLTAYAH